MDIYFVGDIHGEFKEFLYKIKRTQLQNAYLIFAGDFGVGFYSENYYIDIFNHINKYLIENNIHFYAVRGNHDNPEYFDNRKYGNITLVKDYTILNLLNTNILCLGGAYSIDRFDRIKEYKDKLKKIKKYNKKPNKTYWIDEYFIYDENFDFENSNIDIVVSHTAPNFCYPLLKNNLEYFAINDNVIIADCDKERELLNKVYNRLKHNLKYWFYGHFHVSHTECIDNAYFNALNIDEIKTIYFEKFI